MGSGKTTIGSQLARILGYEFVDMDQMIEDTAGMSVPEYFPNLGEEVFRKWEHKILLELCKGEKLVVAQWRRCTLPWNHDVDHEK